MERRHGDAVAGLVREVRLACRRLGARVSADERRPSWAWCCAQTLRVVQEYSMGTTIGIIDSELQMAWCEGSGSRRRGELAALALDHRFDPLTRMLELEVLDAPQVQPNKVDLLAVRHTESGERVQCILPAKLAALREDESPLIGVGRMLRVSGCRMVRLPKPGQLGLGDQPAYRADGDGVLTLLPTPCTSIMLGTGPGAPKDVGDISTDDMLMMTFEGLTALLSPGCCDVSLNVRVISIEPIQQEDGQRNPNISKAVMRWRNVVLGDDETADTCHLFLSDDQIFLADQFAAGDYIGLQNPRVVSEGSQGVHLEMDDDRTIIYVREVAGQHAAASVAQPQASGSGGQSGAASHESQLLDESGAMIRVLEIEAVRRLSQGRRGSICYESDTSASATSSARRASLGSQLLSPDDVAMRRQLTIRCESVGDIDCEGSRQSVAETAVIVVEYTARRDNSNDLAVEIRAGQVLWVAGLESIKSRTRSWDRPGEGISQGPREATARSEAWYSLQLPLDTAHALTAASTRSGPADEQAMRGKLVIVSCAIGLLAAPWMRQPRSLECCLQRPTQLVHCRATLTDIEIWDDVGTVAPLPAPPLAEQFSQGKGAPKISAAVAAAMKRFGETLRLTFDDGSTSLRVCAHPRAVEALWHLPVHELVQLSAVNQLARLHEALGATFDLLLSLVPMQAAPQSCAMASDPTGSNQQRQKKSTDAAEYRLDGCARCSEDGLYVRLQSQLNTLAGSS